MIDEWNGLAVLLADMIEKYAREKYFMKKDSEDIYIIEFEDDMLEEESKKDF